MRRSSSSLPHSGAFCGGIFGLPLTQTRCPPLFVPLSPDLVRTVIRGCHSKLLKDVWSVFFFALVCLYKKAIVLAVAGFSATVRPLRSKNAQHSFRGRSSWLTTAGSRKLDVSRSLTRLTLQSKRESSFAAARGGARSAEATVAGTVT